MHRRINPSLPFLQFLSETHVLYVNPTRIYRKICLKIYSNYNSIVRLDRREKEQEEEGNLAGNLSICFKLRMEVNDSRTIFVFFFFFSYIVEESRSWRGYCLSCSFVVNLGLWPANLFWLLSSRLFDQGGRGWAIKPLSFRSKTIGLTNSYETGSLEAPARNTFAVTCSNLSRFMVKNGRCYRRLSPKIVLLSPLLSHCVIRLPELIAERETGIW